MRNVIHGANGNAAWKGKLPRDPYSQHRALFRARLVNSFPKTLLVFKKSFSLFYPHVQRPRVLHPLSKAFCSFQILTVFAFSLYNLVMNIAEYLNQPVLGAYVPPEFENNFEEMDDLTFSDEEAEIISALKQLTDADGREHGIVLVNGAPFGDFIQGTDRSIPLDKASLPRDGRVSLFHSHSNSAPPSRADLSYFCVESVDRICAVAYNGDVFTVDIDSGYRPDVREFNAVCDRIDREVDSEIVFDARVIDWTEDERNYRAMHESFFRICRYFKWTMRGGRL